MDYMDGREQATAYAEAALENMARHGVPRTPSNFEVWYTHASGRDIDLSKELDILVSNDQPKAAESKDYPLIQDHALTGRRTRPA